MTLDDWLAHCERLHPKTIDMTLDRVSAVKDKLGIAFDCPVIVVAGTNGKGSTCAMLEAVLLQSGYRVGLYIKPHFLDFNERARINGEMATDEALVAAFDVVEQARGETDLTYFEFTTLAIMHLISKAGVDVAILEVGLGGRLDAVNVIDADVSIVTSIDIDHKDYLGDTREEIGFEKAGIFRPGKPAICSDPQPPQSHRPRAGGAHRAQHGGCARPARSRSRGGGGGAAARRQRPGVGDPRHRHRQAQARPARLARHPALRGARQRCRQRRRWPRLQRDLAEVRREPPT